MNTKRILKTTRLLILSILAGILILSGCGPAQPTNTFIPPTQEPTSALPPTPTPVPFATWSTNFANVTDPAASGIFNNGTNPGISLETADVPSGGKAIRFTGTIGKAWAQQYGPTFNLATLAGLSAGNSFNLSDKILKLDVFVPQGSPLHYFYVDVTDDTQQWVCVRFFQSDPYLGQWHTYTADVSMDITLKAWRQWDSDASPNLSDDQAVQLLKHATNIFILAMNTQDYPSTEAYFEMDSLGWAPSGPMPAYDASVDSLRKFAPASLPMGGFNEISDIYDPDLVRNFVQEFNMIRSPNRFPSVEPAGDVMTYAASWSPKASEDYMHDAYGMTMLRDTGLWLSSPTDIPVWLTK